MKNYGFDKLYREAMGKSGLSANFIGSPKNTTTMSNKLISKEFNFSIKNEYPEAKTIALHLAGFPDLAAMKEKYSVDAVLASGIMLTQGADATLKRLMCEVQSDVKINHLQKYIETYPVTIRDLNIMSDNKDNFLLSVDACIPNPFEVVPLVSVPLRQWKDSKAIDQNSLTASNINIKIYKSVLVLLHIKASSQIDYSATVLYEDSVSQVANFNG